MEAFYLYILQVNIGILAFYLLYRFLLVHDTFLEMRRAYWWLVWATVFAYPWVELHAVRGEAMPLQVVMADYVETITLVASAVAPVEAPSWTWQDALAGVWALGAAVLVVRFLVQLAVVCRLAWRGRKLVWHGQRVIALDSGEQPFSFFGWIFVNPERYSEEELEEIMAHEATHARQRHSWDVVVSELLCCLFWFNPAVWLAKRYIRQNLEFLADRAVMRAGFDRKSYQYHLLRLSYGVGVEQIVNSFNVSLLKRRIMMMNRKKSGRTGVLKYALLFPVAGLLVLSANAEAVAETAEHVAAQWTAPDGTVTMTGTVVDENGKPLPGVTVVLKGTMLGVRTDAAGTFSIQAREGQTLVFTYVGRQTQEVPFNPDKPDIRVVMPLVDTLLDEVKAGDNNAKDNSEERLVGKDGSCWIGEGPYFVEGDVYEYIAEHVRYPEEALKNKWEGKVEVAFTIDSTGKIFRTEIFRGVNPVLDAEALRVIREMPDWRPGKHRGNPINVWFVLPVNFVLPENAQKTPETASAESVLQHAAGNAQSGKDTLIEQGEMFIEGLIMPEFSGGSVNKYIADNLRYPAAAKEKGIEGKVYVQFIVDTTGKVIYPKIIRGVSPELDAEALRLIREMPEWKPATNFGKPVTMSYTLPIYFPLKSDDSAGNAQAGKDTLIVQGETFYVVEDMPKFPGGNIQQYVADNLRYPAAAKEKGIEGKVYVRFVIDTTGKTIAPEIVRGVSPELDAEALRLVREMPAWQPGMQGGKPVRVSFTLPINFRLTPEKQETPSAQAASAPGSTDDGKVAVHTMVADSIFVSATDVTGRGNSHGEHEQMALEEILSKAGKKLLFFVDNQEQPSDFDILSLNPQTVEHVLIAHGTKMACMNGKKLKNKTLVLISTRD